MITGRVNDIERERERLCYKGIYEDLNAESVS